MRKVLVLLAVTCLLVAIVISYSTTPKELTIGLVPSTTPEKMIAGCEPLRLYLEKFLHVKVKVVISEDYLSLIKAMKVKKIDIGWYGAFSYIAAESEMKLEPMVIQSRYTTGTTYHSIIIARTDSGIQSLEDLQGESFAFVDKGSTSGFVIPMALFKSRDLDYKQFLGPISFSGSHDTLLKDVMSKKVEAGAMEDITYAKKLETGEIKPEEVRVIWKSNAIPGSPYMARAELNSKLKNGFKKAMLQMNVKDPEAMHAFDTKVEKYIEFEPSMYNEIRNIATILGKDYIHEQFLHKK